MALFKSLNHLRRIRAAVTSARKRWLAWRYGVRIADSASISLSSRFVTPFSGGIVIGEDSLVAFKTLLVAAVDDSGCRRPVIVGQRCFIGGGSMILPGVTVGDGSIVGAGAVVAEDVPPGCIVAGNPARIVRRAIVVGRFGRLAGADETTRREWRP